MRNPSLLASGLAVLLAGCWIDPVEVSPSAPPAATPAVPVAAPVPADRSASGACPLLEPAALEAMGFTVRWHSEVKASTPVHLYLGEHVCYLETAESTVHAIDRQDGYYRWIHPLRGPLQVPPGEGDGVAYFASSSVLDAVDLGTGKVDWTQRLPFRPVTEPAANDFYLGMGASDGSVYAFRLRESDPKAPGGFRVTHDLLWHWSVGNPLQAPPVLPRDAAEQMLGVGGNGELESRALPDGRTRWRYPYHGAMGPVRGAVAYDLLSLSGQERPERALLVGSLDHHLLALDPQGGTLLASYLATDAIEVKPLVLSYVKPGVTPDWTVVRETYCLSLDGRLACLRTEDAHKAKRDASGAPLLDDKKRPQWLSEEEDGDDVYGGESEEAARPAGDPAEDGAIRRPVRRPLHWELRCLWTADDVARVICRGRSGIYVQGRDGRLRLLDESGRERWSRSLEGVAALSANPSNPFREGAEDPSLYLLDAHGIVWCLEEKR